MSETTTQEASAAEAGRVDPGVRLWNDLTATEKALAEKYKCDPANNGGWCDGTKVGSRMRCPKHSFSSTRQRLCRIGIDKSIDYGM